MKAKLRNPFPKSILGPITKIGPSFLGFALFNYLFQNWFKIKKDKLKIQKINLKKLKTKIKNNNLHLNSESNDSTGLYYKLNLIKNLVSY